MSAYYSHWPPYVPVHERRRNAEREMAKLRKKGRPVAPVAIAGRKIAATFWGQAWCENLERYSDFENRLPRGRSYVRNGSVVDLRIAAGKIDALVSGSSIYRVEVEVSPVPKARWSTIRKDCAGGIESLVELLQGRLSRGVMERICREKGGLFPSPAEMKFSCSCPDGAVMCKHVAAALYGVGARLDDQPALLFKLRKVDEKDLIAKAGKGMPLAKRAPKAAKVLEGGDLSEMFGLEMAAGVKAGGREGRAARGRKAKPARAGAARRTKAIARRGSATKADPAPSKTAAPGRSPRKR